MRRAIAAAALAASLGVGIFAEDAPARLDITQAVAAALRSNLDIRSAAVESRIKKRIDDFGFNSFLPTLSVSATAARLNQAPSALVPVAPLGGGVYDRVYDYTASERNLALGLTVQEVFSPAYFVQMNLRALDYQQSGLQRAQAEKQVIASVKKIFYQLLIQKEAIDLTQTRLDNADERLRQAKISNDLGQGNELNYMYEKANVDSIVPELRSMKTARSRSLAAFQEMLGYAARPDMELAGSLDDEKSDPGDAPAASDRFDTAAADLTLKQLKSSLRMQDMALLPTLVFQYSADPALNGPTSSSVFDTGNWNQSSGALSVTLSWNLTGFIPGTDSQLKRAELKDRIALALEQSASTRRKAAQDAEDSKRLVQDSLAKIENLKSVKEATRRSFVLTEASYKSGMGRYLDLQSAELSWLNAQLSLLNERLNLASLLWDLDAKYLGSR